MKQRDFVNVLGYLFGVMVIIAAAMLVAFGPLTF